MPDYSTPWPGGNGPSSFASDVAISLGLQFKVTSQAWLKGFRFWRGTTDITGSIVGRLYQVDGAASGHAVSDTDVSFSLSGTGWQVALLSTPKALTINQDYKATVFFPSNYSATGGYFTGGDGSAGFTNGPLTIPNAASSTDGQDTFVTGASIAYPTSTFNGGNFWVDVIVTDTEPSGDINTSSFFSFM